MKKILYIVLPLFFCISCGKFLEPKSPSEFTPKNVLSLGEMLLRDAYLGPARDYQPLYFLLEPFSDDIEMTSESIYFKDTQAESQYQRLVGITSNALDDMTFPTWVKSSWEVSYQSILACNAALDYMDAVSGTVSEKAYVKAQALFLRALRYFYLVNQYGHPYNFNKKALGVILKLDSNLTVETKDRATVEEVYKQILTDLLEAEKCWEQVEDSKHFKQDFKINLPATQLLIARVHLFMENWEQAIAYAEKVTKWENFSLLDLNGIAQPAVKLVNYGNYDNSETILPFGEMRETIVLLNNSQKIPKIDPTSTAEAERYRNIFVASPSLLALFNESDLRKDLYIFNEWTSDLINESTGKKGSFLPGVKAVFGKINHDSNQRPDINQFNTSLSFRLSEAYLILAESYAMLNKPSEALSAINTIRAKRIERANYTPTEGLSGNDLIQFVREERRRELCFECSRWFDMRRWGMKSFTRQWKKDGKVETTYVIPEKDNGFTFPIPYKVMKRNSGITQNPLSPRTI